MNGAWIRAGSIVAALLAAAAPAAAAPDPDPGRYELNWIIGPHPLPAGDFWVAKQGQIVETRLLPPELYVAERPVTAADGTLLMGAGQQIVKLRARQLIACNIRRGASGRASGRRVCLVDTDGDERFDSYFERGTGEYYWFALSGEIPGQMRPISAPAFRAAPADQLADAPILTVHFQRILDGGLTVPVQMDGSNLVRFHFKVGTRGRREWMIRDCQSGAVPSYCASSIFPSQFRFAGLVVDLLERRGEDIRVRVAAPFEPRAVRLVNTGPYTTGALMLVGDR